MDGVDSHHAFQTKILKCDNKCKHRHPSRSSSLRANVVCGGICIVHWNQCAVFQSVSLSLHHQMEAQSKSGYTVASIHTCHEASPRHSRKKLPRNVHDKRRTFQFENAIASANECTARKLSFHCDNRSNCGLLLMHSSMPLSTVTVYSYLLARGAIQNH